MRATLTDFLDIVIALSNDEMRNLEKKTIEGKVFCNCLVKAEIFVSRGATSDEFFELATEPEDAMMDAKVFRIIISYYGYQLLRQRRYAGDRRAYGWARINIYVE